MGYESIPEIASWTSSGYGYALMFLAMMFEGPVITAAGSFGAALGYFDLRVIFLLSIAGNTVPDTIYYAIGFWGRHKLIDRYLKYLRIPEEKLLRLEHLYHTHVGKTIAMVKLIPMLGPPGLVAAGMAKVPLKKYFFWITAVTLPASLVFLMLGYYFGATFAKIAYYTDYATYAILAIGVIFLFAWYIYKKFSGYIAKKIDRKKDVQ